MLVASVALTAVRGDTLVLEFAVTDEAGVVSNITGTTPAFALAPIRGGTTLESPASATAAVTDAEGGLFRVTMAASVTATLTLEVYRYQALLEDLSDNVQTVARGTIHFVDRQATA